jgi:hypothetical protein
MTGRERFACFFALVAMAGVTGCMAPSQPTPAPQPIPGGATPGSFTLYLVDSTQGVLIETDPAGLTVGRVATN